MKSEKKHMNRISISTKNIKKKKKKKNQILALKHTITEMRNFPEWFNHKLGQVKKRLGNFKEII